MYAVYDKTNLHYFGSDVVAAFEVFKVNSQSNFKQLNSIDELNKIFDSKIPLNEPSQPNDRFKSKNNRTFKEELLSEAAKKLIDQLTKWGLQKNLAEAIQKNSEVMNKNSKELIGEVRHVGIQTMKTVGDGFIAIGDLLKKATESFE